MSRYIHHVTLTTGHSRRSWLHEIDPMIMGDLRGLLASAREPGGAVIPGVQPVCRLSMLYESSRSCALAVHDDGEAPLLTIGIATHARCGESLWRRLHEPGATRTTIADRPPEPWCAVRIEGGALLYPPPHQLLPTLADMERCIAWAWIEERGRVAE